jgi:hypothetical protein
MGDILTQDGSTAFSISCWVKYTNAGTMMIVSKQDASGYGYLLHTGNSAGVKFTWYPCISAGGSIAVRTSNAYNDGNWHNVLATYDGSGNASGAKIYVDGTLDTNIITDTFTGTSASTGPFQIGARNGTSFPLIATDVSSPTSWWKLDNTTTGIQDSGSASNNGTNNGATEIQTNVWTPRLNGESTTLPTSALTSSDLQFESPYSNFSLDFNGTDNYIDCTDNDIFSFTDGSNDSSYTFSSWIYADSLSTDLNQPNTIISKYATTANEWWFLIENKKLVILNYDQSNPTSIGRKYNTDLVINTWHHVAATYDGSKNVSGFKLYLNGIRVDDTDYNSNTTYGGMQNQTTNVYIGKRDRSDRLSLFNGKIDETAIFNKVLTQAEISQVYNNGYAADLTSLSPVSWWRLGEDAYFVGNDITIPNQISGAPNGTGAGTQTSILVANAPGSYASGVGTNLDVVDRKGEAPESSANSQSINMIPGDVHPYIPGYVPAKVDNIASMSFDGVNDYFIGPTIGFGTNDFSISLWVNYSYGAGNARFNTLIDFRETAYNVNGLSFFLLENKASVYIGGVGTIGTSTITLSQNLWTNIVLTKTSGEYKVYFNDTNSSRSEVLGTNTTSLDEKTANIGIEWDESFGPFNGLMDEFAIFDYALTPKQIKQDIYDASTTGKAADLNNNSNLTAPVAWYRMGD